MIAYRKVKITNIDGSQGIELNDFDGYLMTSPTGLGIYLNNEYLKVGNKRIRTDQQNAFNNIQFNVNIYADEREQVEVKYNTLRNFISKYKSGGFRFYYLANGESDANYMRYIVCEIRILDKTEKSGVASMSVPLTLEPRTLWRADEQRSSTVQTEQNTNLFKFEYEDIAVESGYNAVYTLLPTDVLGITNISISGYNHAILPSEVVLDFDGIRLTNDNRVEGIVGKDGAFVYEAHKSRDVYSVEFNSVTQNITAQVAREVTRSVETSQSDVTVYHGNGTITAKVTQARERDIDVEVRYSIKYRFPSSSPTDTNLYNGAVTIRIKAGTLYGYDVIGSATDIYDNLGSSVELLSVHEVYKERIVDQTDTHTLSGKVFTKSYRPYTAKFLLDSNVENEQYYAVSFTMGTISESEVNNDGDTEIPLRIKIKGYAVNPTVQLLPKDSDTAIQFVKINATIPKDASVVIDSDAENTGIWLIYERTNIKSNFTQYVDISSNMYLRLPQGEYNISSTDEASNVVQTDVYYSKEFFGA